MSDVDVPWTFELAKNKANEAAAEHGLRSYASVDCANFLSDYYLEAEGCWYFFPMDSIEIPEEHWHLRKFAIAVSKSGRLSFAYDFRDDAPKMQAYLEALSLYSLGKLSEAKSAFDAFQKRYPQS
jgi:TolA-binding protein